MRVATSMKDIEFPLFLPGVRVNTSPTDYHPLKQFPDDEIRRKELGVCRRNRGVLSGSSVKANSYSANSNAYIVDSPIPTVHYRAISIVTLTGR